MYPWTCAPYTVPTQKLLVRIPAIQINSIIVLRVQHWVEPILSCSLFTHFTNHNIRIIDIFLGNEPRKLHLALRCFMDGVKADAENKEVSMVACVERVTVFAEDGHFGLTLKVSFPHWLSFTFRVSFCGCALCMVVTNFWMIFLPSLLERTRAFMSFVISLKVACRRDEQVSLNLQQNFNIRTCLQLWAYPRETSGQVVAFTTNIISVKAEISLHRLEWGELKILIRWLWMRCTENP